MHARLEPVAAQLIRCVFAAINAIYGALIAWRVVAPVRLDPEAILAAARRSAGLPEPAAPPCYPDALGVLCASYERDCDLRVTGRLALRELLTRACATRLRLDALEASRPEIFETALNAPLILFGLPRSGSTRLHRLLGKVAGARGLEMWEFRDVVPSADRGSDADRKTRARMGVFLLRALAPDLDKKHFIDADAPEEDLELFDATLFSPTFWRLAPCYSYLEWYERQDPLPAYRTYRKLLQVLQFERPGARFVLKLPDHLGHAAALRRCLPEARLVATRRDPAPVVASYNSLNATVQAVSTATIDAGRNGAAGLRLWAWMAKRYDAAKKAGEADGVLDVDYGDIRDTPLDVVARIHETFKIPLTAADRAAVRAAVAAEPQHARGRHAYALADFQLTDAAVERAFS